MLEVCREARCASPNPLPPLAHNGAAKAAGDERIADRQRHCRSFPLFGERGLPCDSSKSTAGWEGKRMVRTQYRGAPSSRENCPPGTVDSSGEVELRFRNAWRT